MGVANNATDSIVQADAAGDATADHGLFFTDTDG
jgi:hypothetical protein